MREVPARESTSWQIVEPLKCNRCHGGRLCEMPLANIHQKQWYVQWARWGAGHEIWTALPPAGETWSLDSLIRSRWPELGESGQRHAKHIGILSKHRSASAMLLPSGSLNVGLRGKQGW